MQRIFSLFSVQNPDMCVQTEIDCLSTVLDSVPISESGILYFYTDGVFTPFYTIKLTLGRRRRVLRSPALIQKISISDNF